MSFLKAISLIACLAGGLTAGAAQDTRLRYEGSESIASLFAKTDITCILRTWRIKGVLVCVVSGQPRTCLWIENAYPCGIIEVVRQRGGAHLAEAAPILKGLEGIALFGSSSSHTTVSDSGTALQFTEARVYTYVPPHFDGLVLPIVRPQGSLFNVNYVSELDGFGWRTGLVDLLADPLGAAKMVALPSCAALPDVQRCAGLWGSYIPRIGFVSHPSEVMSAYLLGLRAGRVAAEPGARIVVSRYPFQPRTGHYIQMVRPTLKGCAQIGTPIVRPLEAGATSLQGAYLFVHFGVFEECRGCLPVRLADPRPPIGP